MWNNNRPMSLMGQPPFIINNSRPPLIVNQNFRFQPQPLMALVTPSSPCLSNEISQLHHFRPIIPTLSPQSLAPQQQNRQKRPNNSLDLDNKKIFRFEKNNRNNQSRLDTLKNDIQQSYRIDNQPQSLLSLEIPPPQLMNLRIQKPHNSFSTLKENTLEDLESSLKLTQKQKHKLVSIEDLTRRPGLDKRPPKIAAILRGLPGSGKSHIANLIKLDEEKNNGQKPKILSIDNYFMIEQEEYVNGSKSKQIVMKYEYDKEMDEVYQKSLVKSFKKTIDDDLFNFIIVDMVNEKLAYLEEMTNYATEKSYSVYIIEILGDIIQCTNRNIHKRSFKEIYEVLQKWEPLPTTYTKLDVRCLLQEDCIETVEMDDVSIDESNQMSNTEAKQSDDDIILPGKSKWETDTSEDRLKKLDGFSLKRHRVSDIDTSLSLDDYIKNTTDDHESNKKRVRWKDFEEEKKQIKQKEVGFVVNQQSIDSNKQFSGLVNYKYF